MGIFFRLNAKLIILIILVAFLSPCLSIQQYNLASNKEGRNIDTIEQVGIYAMRRRRREKFDHSSSCK